MALGCEYLLTCKANLTVVNLLEFSDVLFGLLADDGVFLPKHYFSVMRGPICFSSFPFSLECFDAGRFPKFWKMSSTGISLTPISGISTQVSRFGIDECPMKLLCLTRQ